MLWGFQWQGSGTNWFKQAYDVYQEQEYNGLCGSNGILQCSNDMVPAESLFPSKYDT